MEKTGWMMVLGTVVLAMVATVGSGAEIFYTMNIASSSDEYGGYDYYGGYEYMNSRDTGNPDVENGLFNGSFSTMMYRGCDVVTINGVKTLFWVEDFNGGWQYVVKREWTGSEWGPEETCFYRTSEGIGGVAVAMHGGTYEMYYTLDSRRDGSMSKVFKRTLNMATGQWENEREVTELQADNGNRSYLGVAVGDIDGDGNLDLFLSRWLGPSYQYPDIIQYTLTNGQWNYVRDVQSLGGTVRVYSDLAIGDTDGDGQMELLYSQKMGGPNYNYVETMEWNGSGFDGPVTLFQETNGWRDYDGVAMVQPEGPSNARFDVPAAGVVTIDGSLSDWPASAAWSQPYLYWNGSRLTSTTRAKFAWSPAANRLYVAIETNEASGRPGGHAVVGVSTDRNGSAVSGVNSTQLAFDATRSGTGVDILNEIDAYYHTGDKTTGVLAACSNAGGIWTYEIAIPLWSDWRTPAGETALTPGMVVYAYSIMESIFESGNGTDMTYDGNPHFADPNGFGYAAALTLLAPTPTPTPTPGELPGDANNDGKVDVSDLGILAAHYGTTVNATWAMGDFNHDGKVDVSDLGILAAHYGAGAGTSLEFNADAAALGLATEAKEDAPTISTLGCGSMGLPLIAGLFLAGIGLAGLTMKE